jgi:hypothetical protein
MEVFLVCGGWVDTNLKKKKEKTCMHDRYSLVDNGKINKIKTIRKKKTRASSLLKAILWTKFNQP